MEIAEAVVAAAVLVIAAIENHFAVAEIFDSDYLGVLEYVTVLVVALEIDAVEPGVGPAELVEPAEPVELVEFAAAVVIEPLLELGLAFDAAGAVDIEIGTGVVAELAFEQEWVVQAASAVPFVVLLVGLVESYFLALVLNVLDLDYETPEQPGLVTAFVKISADSFAWEFLHLGLEKNNQKWSICTSI